MHTTAYRRYLRIYFVVHRLLPWLWFIGLALCLLVAVLGLGDRWLLAVCLVTIYPALIGWLGLNGLGILLALRSRLRRQHPGQLLGWLFVLAALAAGITFIIGAVWLLVGILRQIVA